LKTILGIHDGYNATASILDEGRVVAAVQEERLTRIKNQGDLPRQAIRDVISLANVDLSTVSRVALGGKYVSYGVYGRKDTRNHYERSGNLTEKLKQPLKNTFIDTLYQRHKARERERQFVELGFDQKKLAPVDHHTSHAAAAYYGSGWKGKVLILTCDGCGDRLSATVSIGENGQLERIAWVPESDSIGRLYAMVTYFLGMMPHEHEYKVMGLAPYVGNPCKAEEQGSPFAGLFEFDRSNPLVWRRSRGVPSMYSAYDLIRKLLYRRRFDHIAVGLQQFTERILTQWVQNCVRETGIRHVACSGGVFMNVKANKEILELPEVDDLFIFPSCGDESNSIGAAYWVYAQHCLKTNRPVNIEPVRSIYWGRGFDDTEAEAALKELEGHKNFRYEYVDNIDRLVAENLAKGEIVARVKGRMEFGARALGNRSILARPDNEKVVRVINDMIKNRDFWMPFAPSVLAERAEDYYLKPRPVPAPYMMIAFDSRPEARHKYPAAQHPYDHSVRPQEVNESWNADYYRLLKYYEEKTGEGIILNTSFNLHGYPIVHRPAEALDVFVRTSLRFLALGNWWVWKE